MSIDMWISNTTILYFIYSRISPPLQHMQIPPPSAPLGHWQLCTSLGYSLLKHKPTLFHRLHRSLISRKRAGPDCVCIHARNGPFNYDTLQRGAHDSLFVMGWGEPDYPIISFFFSFFFFFFFENTKKERRRGKYSQHPIQQPHRPPATPHSAHARLGAARCHAGIRRTHSARS